MRNLTECEALVIGGGQRNIDEFRIIARDGSDVTPQVVTIIGTPWAWAGAGASMLSVIGAGGFFLASYGAPGITANSILVAAGISGVVGGALGLLGWSLYGIYVTARDTPHTGDPNVAYP